MTMICRKSSFFGLHTDQTPPLTAADTKENWLAPVPASLCIFLGSVSLASTQQSECRLGPGGYRKQQTVQISHGGRVMPRINPVNGSSE